MSDNRISGARPHPLLGPMDKDPGRWRPLFYPLEITVGQNAGNQGQGSITLNAQPFIMTRIQGKIVGETATPEATGVYAASGLYQDGQWDLEFRDEMSNYQKGSCPFDLMFGGPHTGYIMELPFPLPFAGNKTLTFRITNRVNRIFPGSVTTFNIGIVLAGIADWGKQNRQSET